MSENVTSGTKTVAARGHTCVSRTIPTRVLWMIRIRQSLSVRRSACGHTPPDSRGSIDHKGQRASNIESGGYGYCGTEPKLYSRPRFRADCFKLCTGCSHCCAIWRSGAGASLGQVRLCIRRPPNCAPMAAASAQLKTICSESGPRGKVGFCAAIAITTALYALPLWPL